MGLARPVVVGKKGQVTLPVAIRKAAHLREGDLIDVELTADGIVLRPRRTIDPTQSWFWTPEWQKGEREADEDLVAGRGDVFHSDEEFLEALRRWSREADAK